MNTQFKQESASAGKRQELSREQVATRLWAGLAQLPASEVGPLAGREPKWAWRGVLLDSARTCYDVQEIRVFLELMARYGFNRLHWHLTDDAGWRFPVPGYPFLTSVSAQLERSDFSNYTNTPRGVIERCCELAPTRWRAGYYTEEEIRQVVEWAEALGIEVVPEVDLPGHMLAAIKAYPDLGRPAHVPEPAGSLREGQYWPAQNDLLWPTPAAVEFVEAALDQVLSLFPRSSVIHLGGDECAYQQWAADPSLKGWLAERGLSEIPQIQTWFMQLAARRVREAGRRVAGWDEVCALYDDAELLAFAWDEVRGMERVEGGTSEFIYCDARHLYLNRVDPDVPEQRGMTPPISVADILRSPWPLASAERCAGVQACLWSEFILDLEDLLDMGFPRLLAVSERMWNPRAEQSMEAVAREQEVLSAWMRAALS